MTIGISRDRAAPDEGKIVTRAPLVPKGESTAVATAGGCSERCAA